eukprot:gene16160-919_t
MLRMGMLAVLAPVGAASSLPADGPCLCVFDVDRTLTAKQAETATCTKTKE